MTLEVYTARIGVYRGPDVLNITRGSGKGDALVFAPSSGLLQRTKKQQQDAKEALHLATNESQAMDADWLSAQAWGRYYGMYCAEMKRSYNKHRRVWDEILGRDRVTFECYCSNAHCHRHILGRAILPSLGARYCGEVFP